MIHRLLFWPKFPQKTLLCFLPLSIYLPLDPVRREFWPPLKGLYTVVTNTLWGRGLSSSHSVRTSLFPTQLILFCEKLLFASCCLGFQSCPNTKQWVTTFSCSVPLTSTNMSLCRKELDDFSVVCLYLYLSNLYHRHRQFLVGVFLSQGAIKSIHRSSPNPTSSILFNNSFTPGFSLGKVYKDDLSLKDEDISCSVVWGRTIIGFR